ncbi:unnamed protein product [Brassicogethes aeneus]|uniref:Uncharacterized protein n=1 Tax=Brassicogethes aeneus TaxID=1431903 RepID=A0A9P0AXD4_BRAAE|nr:unnamed protein product [Brassicogethes aeneus]
MKTTDKECEVKKINMKNTRWKICLICERLTLEKWFYFSVWVGSIMYGIYYFAKSSNDFFRNYVDYYDDFEEGTFLNRKRDQSDGEFEEISSIFKQFGTLMFASLIIFEIQRKFTNNKEFLKLTQIFISFYGLIHNFGFKYFFVLLSQPLIYTAIVYNFKNKAPLYILVVFNIIWSKWMFTMFIIHKVFDELSIIVAFVGYGWSILKCSCFYFESNVVTKSTFIDLLEFVFYLPTFFYGPILMYTDYEEKYNFEKYKPLRERALSLLKNGLRILFWYVFTYILLHYLYISAMRVEALYDFDSTSLYAYGFLMGTYFQLKYLILYGIGTMFASFYNIPVPALPRCIGRIHLYSDMWKYFDVGLYHYLVKYLYHFYFDIQGCPKIALFKSINIVLNCFLCLK